MTARFFFSERTNTARTGLSRPTRKRAVIDRAYNLPHRRSHVCLVRVRDTSTNLDLLSSRPKGMWMLRWTGEQVLPTIKDAATVYQHVHRYIYASEFVRGKRVLDLMAGEGDGSSILAQTAASVVGIIADEATARYAREKHTKSSVTFIASSLNLQVPDNSFDAIVCFDASEAKFDGTSIPALKERLLKPDGLFILSSENEHELRQQLTASFKQVQAFGQRIYANSSIWPMEPGSDTAVREVVMARDANDDFRAIASGRRSAMSFIAVASDLPSAVQANGTVFIDEGNELLVDKESTIRELTEDKAYQAAALKFSQSQFSERRESLASLQEAFAWHKSQIDSLKKTQGFLETEVAHFKSAIASNEEALAWRASQVRELAQELEAMKASTGWKFVLQVRAIRDRLAFWR